jgi:hypothetical protein
VRLSKGKTAALGVATALPFVGWAIRLIWPLFVVYRPTADWWGTGQERAFRAWFNAYELLGAATALWIFTLVVLYSYFVGLQARGGTIRPVRWVLTLAVTGPVGPALFFYLKIWPAPHGSVKRLWAEKPFLVVSTATVLVALLTISGLTLVYPLGEGMRGLGAWFPLVALTVVLPNLARIAFGVGVAFALGWSIARRTKEPAVRFAAPLDR